jgi:urease accessory protein
MLKGLGASLRAIEAPFEPEAGAYSGGHAHHGAEPNAARIHEYGAHDPEHHDHEH